MLRLFTALLGPVFAKEMVELARRKRYYFNRVFYGTVLLLAVFMIWTDYQRSIQYRQISLIRGMAQLAEQVFTTVSIVQYLAVYFFLPLFLCGVVASEREQGTLELLFTTQLKDHEIVLGKLISRTVVFVLLMLCALPILSIISFYGGIDPDALWRIQGSTLLAILYAAAHSIYFSTVTKSPMGALIRTYWWMGIWIMAIPIFSMIIVSAIMMGTGGPRAGRVWEEYVLGALIVMNPGGNFTMAIIPEAYNQMNKVTYSSLGIDFFPLTFIIPLLWSIFLIWRAVARLRLLPTGLARATSRILVFRKVLEHVGMVEQNWTGWYRKFAQTAYLVVPVRNPLWLRARLSRVYDRERYVGRIQWLGWAVALVFLITLVLLEPRSMHRNGAATAFLVPTWTGVTLLTAIFAGNSFVGDRRRGFLDLMTITPLRPAEMIDGTFLAIWQHLRRSYWLPWFLCIFFALTDAVDLPLIFYSLITAMLFGAVILYQGMACSLPARTVLEALLPTFVFVIFVLIGSAFTIAFFREMHGWFLWIFTAILLVGTWVWQRKKLTAIRVGAYFLAVHLAITSVACAWTVNLNRGANRPQQYPLIAQHPVVLVIMPLENRPRWDFDTTKWRLIFLSYWGGLIVNIVWQRWWMIRYFDELVGRAGNIKQPITPAERAEVVLENDASTPPVPANS